MVLIIILSREGRGKACPGGDGVCCHRRSRQCSGGCELRDEGAAPLGGADLQGRRAADGQYADHAREHYLSGSGSAKLHVSAAGLQLADVSFYVELADVVPRFYVQLPDRGASALLPPLHAGRVAGWQRAAAGAGARPHAQPRRVS